MTQVINLMTGERTEVGGYSLTTALYAARLIKQGMSPTLLAMVPEGCLTQWRTRLDYGNLSMCFMDKFCAGLPCIEAGDRYMHYKGIEVEIMAVCRHTETKEMMVTYREINDPRPLSHPYRHNVWTRPLGMFFEDVFTPGGPVPRFKFLTTGGKS